MSNKEFKQNKIVSYEILDGKGEFVTSYAFELKNLISFLIISQEFSQATIR